MLDPKVKISRRVVRPGLRLRHYGGGDVRSDGQVPMAADLDFNSVALPKNLPAPTLDGHAARKKYVDDSISAATNLLGAKKGCKVIQATQVNGGSPAIVSWASAEYQYGTMWTIGDPTKVYCAQAGIYNLKAFAAIFDGGAGGMLHIYVNGVAVQVVQMVKGASTFGDTSPYIVISVSVVLAVNDYVQLKTSGLNGAGAHTGNGMSMSVDLVASNAAGGGDLLSNGTVPMTADFDNGGFQSKNLPAPVADNDAARKKYVDDEIAAAVVAVGGVPYQKAVARRTSGNVVVPGSIADIAGLSVNIVEVAGGGEVVVAFDATYNLNQVVSLTVTLDVDGGSIVRTFDVLNCIIGAGSDTITALHVHVECPIALTAGAHTIKVRHAGANATLVSSSASRPASLVVDYQA